MELQTYNVLATMVILMNRTIVIGFILLLLTACSTNEDISTQASDTRSKSRTQKRHSTHLENVNIVFQDNNKEI